MCVRALLKRGGHLVTSGCICLLSVCDVKYEHMHSFLDFYSDTPGKQILKGREVIKLGEEGE